MTFQDQLADFYVKAQDNPDTPVFWPGGFAKSLLNQAYQDMARRTPGGLRQVVSFWPTPGAQPSLAVNIQGLYQPNPADMPSGAVFDEVRWLMIAATMYLPATGVREAAARFSDWNTVTSDIPVLYIPHAVQEGSVYLVPAPDAPLTTLIGEVSYQHPVLAANGDVCCFPASYHDLPVHRALSLAFGMAGDSQDLQQAGAFGSLYEEGMTAYVNQVIRGFDASPPRTRPRFH